jgi:hypothetical protein
MARMGERSRVKVAFTVPGNGDIDDEHKENNGTRKKLGYELKQ